MNDRRSTIVARHLLRCGCRNGDVVAVAMDRQSDLIAVLLGILKAGAVYLPLDKQNPCSGYNIFCAIPMPGYW